MSISQDLRFSDAELADQRRVNRTLARLPRFAVTGPIRLATLRMLLRLADLGADRSLRRRGIMVESVVVRHRDRTLRFRVLRPTEPPRAVVLDIHGGAWALGTPSMDDKANAAIVREAGAVVFALDYRVALPRPIAALQEESALALDWLLNGADPSIAALPVAVVGESAGAHLLLGGLIAVRDAGTALSRIRGMVLHCGVYDLGGSPSARAAGRDTLVLHGPSLSRQIERLLPGLGETARRAPALSPLFANLRGMPPALILVGDIDPLRDDSMALADALRRAGGAVAIERLPAAPHGIIHLRGGYAARVRRAAARWLDARLAND